MYAHKRLHTGITCINIYKTWPLFFYTHTFAALLQYTVRPKNYTRCSCFVGDRRNDCDASLNNMGVSITHYRDVIMSTLVSQITSLTVVYSTVYSGADQRKHQSPVSLAFVRWPVKSPHKGPVTRKMFPLDDVIMITQQDRWYSQKKTKQGWVHIQNIFSVVCW